MFLTAPHVKEVLFVYVANKRILNLGVECLVSHQGTYRHLTGGQDIGDKRCGTTMDVPLDRCFDFIETAGVPE